MSCVTYNDSECPYAKIINVFGFLSICHADDSLPERQFCRSDSFARAPVLPERQRFCQSASFARASASPERQFRQSASFARAPVLPERQFAKVPVSFARAPVCQFCQSATEFCQSVSFARAPVC